MRLLKIITVAFVLIIPGLPGYAAYASSRGVKVEVSVIHASNRDNFVDPRLEDLKRQLSAFNFTSYRLLDTHSLNLRFNTTGSITLPGDRVVTVTPKSRDEDGRLRLRLTLGDAIDTTYSISEGASLIIGGPRHDGGHLILAVTQTAAR